jgi:hypothetical protein
MGSLRILFHKDLYTTKGIRGSRQHIYERIRGGTFPRPDGRTTDSPSAPMWWFESTIDNYLRERARKLKAAKETAE